MTVTEVCFEVGYSSLGTFSTKFQSRVGMAPTQSGNGYWLVARDGGVFCFGDASFFGSTGGQGLRALIGGMVPTTTGAGYWLWGQDGSVHPFGDAGDQGEEVGRLREGVAPARVMAPARQVSRLD